MAYPTQSADAAVDEVDRIAISTKSFAIRRRDEMAAGNTPSTTIFDVAIQIKSTRDRLATLAAIPGIVERARAKKNTPSLDVAAEFQNMLNAMDSVIAWVAANFPTDNDGYLLSSTLGADGPIDRQFTPQQTATFRTVLDNLIATID